MKKSLHRVRIFIERATERICNAISAEFRIMVIILMVMVHTLLQKKTPLKTKGNAKMKVIQLKK